MRITLRRERARLAASVLMPVSISRALLGHRKISSPMARAPLSSPDKVSTGPEKPKSGAPDTAVDMWIIGPRLAPHGGRRPAVLGGHGFRPRRDRDLISRRRGVPVKHGHCIAGIKLEVIADQGEFLEDVTGDRNNMAADLVGLKDVEQLARARPQQFDFAAVGNQLEGPTHVGYGIPLGIGDAAREHRNHGLRAIRYRLADAR